MAQGQTVACAAAYFFGVIFLVLVAWTVAAFTSAFYRPPTQAPTGLPGPGNAGANGANTAPSILAVARNVAAVTRSNKCTGTCGTLVAQGVIYAVAAIIALVATVACAAKAGSRTTGGVAAPVT